MYRVLFRKQVHSCFAALSSGDVFLEKVVQLPFPPYHGLNIQLEDLDLRIEEKNEIYWIHKSKHFEVYLKADKTIYELCLRSGIYSDSDPVKEKFREVVESYVKGGWQLRKRDRKKIEKIKQEDDSGTGSNN